MERIRLIEKLLQSCMLSAMAEINYFEKPRTYTRGESDLYMREAHLVVAVGPEGGLTMGELASRMGITQGAVSQLAARLERKRYLLRSKSAQDRRQTVAALTEKGKRLCAEHIAYDVESYQKVSQSLEDYSDEELTKLIEYEAKMREIFTKFE